MENREKRVENFIIFLKNFDTKKLARAEYIFNPWTMSDYSDIKDAPNIRCKNLKKYLNERKDADYVLLSESPSKGARYTGIAITSEKVIEDYNLDFEYTSINHKRFAKNEYELTAKKVWQEISKSKNTFAFWNVFAFNIHKKDNKWFETPEKDELLANKYILEAFLKLYPKSKIIALGRTAKDYLALLGINNVDSVRHPSMDFYKEFPKEFKKYL